MKPIDLAYNRAVKETTLCSIGKGDCNRGLTTVPCRYRGRQHPRAYVLNLAHQMLADGVDGSTLPMLKDAKTLEQTE